MEIQKFENIQISVNGNQKKEVRAIREFLMNIEELKNHKEFIKSLKNPLWLSLEEYNKEHAEDLSAAA